MLFKNRSFRIIWGLLKYILSRAFQKVRHNYPPSQYILSIMLLVINNKHLFFTNSHVHSIDTGNNYNIHIECYKLHIKEHPIGEQPCSTSFDHVLNSWETIHSNLKRNNHIFTYPLLLYRKKLYICKNVIIDYLQ